MKDATDWAPDSLPENRTESDRIAGLTRYHLRHLPGAVHAGSVAGHGSEERICVFYRRLYNEMNALLISGMGVLDRGPDSESYVCTVVLPFVVVAGPADRGGGDPRDRHRSAGGIGRTSGASRGTTGSWRGGHP